MAFPFVDTAEQLAQEWAPGSLWRGTLLSPTKVMAFNSKCPSFCLIFCRRELLPSTVVSSSSVKPTNLTRQRST